MENSFMRISSYIFFGLSFSTFLISGCNNSSNVKSAPISNTVDGDITVHLTQDQQAMILKTYDYGLNSLTDIDEMLLSAVIRRLKVAINPEYELNG